MRILKTLGILIIVAVAVALILTLLLPTSRRIERQITINAAPAVVYEYLSKLDNFNKWSAWSNNDQSLKHTITGNDGTLGATSNWKGDPELSGEGQIKISSLEINKEVEHEIHFLSPNKMDAKSEFDLQEMGGQTKIRWQFELATPRPWNIFNMFNNMEKSMGQDFDQGLRNLKAAIERGSPIAEEKGYPVNQMNFPPTTFAIYRQRIGWAEIPVFYSTNFPRIQDIVAQAGVTPSIPHGLYFEWDEKKQEADLAAGMPVLAGTKLNQPDISIYEVPGSKAVYVDYFGAHDKSASAYANLEKYVTDNKLKRKTPVIEEFITNPLIEKDTSKWLTKIIFLVE